MPLAQDGVVPMSQLPAIFRWNPPVAIGIAAALAFLLLAGIVRVWQWWRFRRAGDEPILLFDLNPTRQQKDRASPPSSVGDTNPVTPQLAKSDQAWLGDLERSILGDAPRPVEPTELGNGKLHTPPPAPDPVLARNGSSVSRFPDYDPDEDSTLRLLPGRLEVAAGYEKGEIRFVHRPGNNRYTFGRSRGPKFEHIHLPVPTVSRMHAVMEFVNGRWYIGNLSNTNRVVVNGQELTSDDGLRPIADGARIEMGEVAFIFREN